MEKNKKIGALIYWIILVMTSAVGIIAICEVISWWLILVFLPLGYYNYKFGEMMREYLKKNE